jgi:hypothetical protein
MQPRGRRSQSGEQNEPSARPTPSGTIDLYSVANRLAPLYLADMPFCRHPRVSWRWARTFLPYLSVERVVFATAQLGTYRICVACVDGSVSCSMSAGRTRYFLGCTRLRSFEAAKLGHYSKGDYRKQTNRWTVLPARCARCWGWGPPKMAMSEPTNRISGRRIRNLPNAPANRLSRRASLRPLPHPTLPALQAKS